MDKEIWKDIPGLGGYYQLSNQGRVFRRRVKSNTNNRNYDEHFVKLRHGGFRASYDGTQENVQVKPLMFLLFGIGDVTSDDDEEWKEIAGYDGRYYISNKGRVKKSEYVNSVGATMSECILKDRNGYVVLIDNMGHHNTTPIAALLYDYFKIGEVEDLPDEEWKDIPGYEGKYQVSNMGRVKRLDHTVETKQGRTQRNLPVIFEHDVGKHGYHRVCIDDVHYLVHRLVATAFVPNPNNYPCVDHIDTNTHNNAASNLRWCTHQMNMNNALTIENMKSDSAPGRKVVVYKDDKKLGEFCSISKLERLSAAVYGAKFNRRNVAKVIDTGEEYQGYFFRSE